MSLLVDLGNTRLKWAQVGADERLGEVRAVAHDGDVARAVQRIDAGAVEAVRVASVGGPALNAALRDALRHRFGCEVLFAETRAECAGLHVAYADPSRLGVDRWLAMLGVWRQQRGAFCVVSAGTALTFDAVDADGRHLGGLIAPGVTTMAESVLGRTRFPADSLPEAAGPALGTDTESCVAQGALHAALGLIDRAAAGAKGPRVICGGDALRLLPGLGGEWQLEPYAVMRGLQACAQVPEDAPRR